MCDTFYAPGRGSFFFGKNSDRKPEEPQALCLLPKGAPSPKSIITGGSIDYTDKGHAVLLSKPSWMAGGEIGINEKGVAIGNEAVFSRWPVKKDGVLGMDFLRVALRSSDTAEEAVAILADLIGRFDQGGNGAFRGKLYYHNSYLVTGFDGAYVLETAARRWAWKKLDGPAAISNSYSLGLDYKRLDPETRKAISPVNEKMACRDEADAGRIGQKAPWKPYVESRLHAFFTKGDARRRALTARVAKDDFSLADAFSALRARSLPDPERSGASAVVCAHDRDNLGYPTTASMVVEYLPGAPSEEGGGKRGRSSKNEGPSVGRPLCRVWFTGTSYPDISLYKPVILADGVFTPLWTGYDYGEDSTASLEYWRKGREFYLHRGKALSLSGPGRTLDPGFLKSRDEAQEGVRRAVSRYGAETLSSVRAEIAAIVGAWESSWWRA